MPRLTDADEKMLFALGIDERLIERAGIVRVDSTEAQETFGINLDGDSGLAYPYYLPPNGKPPRRVTARIRRDHPPRDTNGRIERKYLSAARDNRHLYFSPCDAAWIEDPTTPVLFVEAEKSALALLAWCERHDRRMIPVALGGCWSWRGRIGKTVNAAGERLDEKGALPDLQIACGRRAYLIYDSNSATNQSVYVAREKLAEELIKLKADVRIIDLPTSPGVNGPDDYVGKLGDAAVFDLFESARRAAVQAGVARAKVWDSRDFLITVFPPREPLAIIDGYDTPVFTTHSINQIFAARGTGKSLMAMALAGVHSTGGKFLNWRMTRPARVLYVDGELPNPQLQDRMRQLFSPDAHIRLITVDDQANGFPSLATAIGQAWLEDNLGDTEILILDSIASLAPFTTNDEENWIPFIMWLQRMRSRGLCIDLLHQAGKAGLQRGHSRGDDPLDVQIKLRARDEECDHLAVELTYEKFRGTKAGVRALSVEFSNDVWTWRALEADKLRLLDEYLCEHPKGSDRTLRKIAEALPELGSHVTIGKLLKKLDSKESDG